MKSFKDAVYTAGGFTASALIAVGLLMVSPGIYFLDLDLNAEPIIMQMVKYGSEYFRQSSICAAPNFFGSSSHMWFSVFLPFLCALPFISRLSAELKGNCRLRLVREGSFRRYWNHTFFRSVFSGTGAVTAGYVIFCGIMYSFFPPNSYFLPRSEYDEDSWEYFMLGRSQLNSGLNSFFDTQSEWVYFINQTLNVFFYAFVISALGLLLYLIFRNKYKTLGIPVMIFFLIDQATCDLFYDGFFKTYAFNPRMLIFGTTYTLEYWGIGAIWYYPIMAVFALALYFAGGAVFRKRVSY